MVKQTTFQTTVVANPAAAEDVTISSQGDVNLPNSADTEILAANTSRRWAEILNKTAATVFIAFGVAADATMLSLGPDEAFVIENEGGYLFLGAVNAFQSSGGAVDVTVTEWES